MNQYGWHWKQIGWLIAFMYAAGAALRLARFNTRITVQDPRYFQGLPSPAAAALLAGLVWVGSDLELEGAQLSVVAMILTALAGGLMVSNVHFHSFKKLKFNERVPFAYAWVMVAGFILVAINPALVLFLLVLSYTFSGLMLAIYRRGKRLRGRRQRPA
jgi:CDP-diacylglycerol--serine O-phosphatidyltransferase